MTKSIGTALAAVLLAGAAANATPTLQFDVNGFSAQARNGAGASVAFGGLTHTGSVSFSVGTGTLNGIFIQSVPSGPFVNAGFSGSTLSGFSGQINLTNGQVTGGNLVVQISNGDSYACAINSGSGAVSTFVGG